MSRRTATTTGCRRAAASTRATTTSARRRPAAPARTATARSRSGSRRFPDAKLYAVGFSLGSGVKGDGVIHDIQVGDTDYQFTDEPAITTADVTGDATVTQVDKRGAQIVKVDIATDPLGANQVEGRKLWFKITDNDDVVYHAKLGAGDEAHVQLRFPDGTGKHKVVIFKGGEVDQKVVVKTGH